MYPLADLLGCPPRTQEAVGSPPIPTRSRGFEAATGDAGEAAKEATASSTTAPATPKKVAEPFGHDTPVLPPPLAYAIDSTTEVTHPAHRPSLAAVSSTFNPGEHLHRAATVIQAAWRGYSVRSMHPQCASVRREMRTRRMESRILLLEGKVRMCHARLQE